MVSSGAWSATTLGVPPRLQANSDYTIYPYNRPLNLVIDGEQFCPACCLCLHRGPRLSAGGGSCVVYTVRLVSWPRSTNRGSPRPRASDTNRRLIHVVSVQRLTPGDVGMGWCRSQFQAFCVRVMSQSLHLSVAANSPAFAGTAGVINRRK